MDATSPYRLTTATLQNQQEAESDAGTGSNIKTFNVINGTIPGVVVIIPNIGVTPTGLISYDFRLIFELVNFVVLIGLISLCGVITNIINLIVFLKQGLNDSISLSLTGLAVSDFCASAVHLWRSICFNPLFSKSTVIPFNTLAVQYVTGAWPFSCFARISSLITAYITFERCLCIVMPLKVKDILTPRRTCCVMLVIYLIIIASVFPFYFAAARLSWVFNEVQNKTLISLVYARNGVFVENIVYLLFAVFQLASFVFVIICSLFIVNGLREKSEWRQKSSSSSSAGNDNLSSRDNKVVKMVLVVAVIFIICYLPTVVNLIAMYSSKKYSMFGQYQNLLQTVWSFVSVLQTTNSAVNMSVYYKMSTKYRQEFRKLFGLDDGTEKNGKN